MGIKRVAGLAWTTTTASWVVLQECGHERLQFYWFRSAVKLFNSMLNTNSNTLRRIVQADLNLQPRSVPAGQLNCWAHFRDCVDVSYMYELFKLGMLLPCKNLLQIWSIGWEVFGETLICQDHRVCELRKHFSFLFTPFFEDFSATQPFLLQQVNNQATCSWIPLSAEQ